MAAEELQNAQQMVVFIWPLTCLLIIMITVNNNLKTVSLSTADESVSFAFLVPDPKRWIGSDWWSNSFIHVLYSFNYDYICGTFSLFNFGFAHLCYLFWGEDDEAFAPQVVEVYKLLFTKTLKTNGLHYEAEFCLMQVTSGLTLDFSVLNVGSLYSPNLFHSRW